MPSSSVRAQTIAPMTRRAQARRVTASVALFLRWLAACAVTLLGLAIVTFAMTRLSPIDPALQMVGDHASQSTYAAARETLGLDLPLPVQFLRYLETALSGNLGLSISTGQPVASDIARTFPATIELATVAIVIGATLGIGLGIAAAMHQGRLVDTLARTISLFGYSVPIFWLGLLMLLLFYARLHWAPGPGRTGIMFQYSVKSVTGFALIDAWLSGKSGAVRDVLAHLTLPATVLGFLRAGLDHPPDPHGDPGRTRPGIRHDGARQRRGQPACRFRPRAAQRLRHADHRGGARLRQPARRRRSH